MLRKKKVYPFREHLFYHASAPEEQVKESIKMCKEELLLTAKWSGDIVNGSVRYTVKNTNDTDEHGEIGVVEITCKLTNLTRGEWWR